MKSKVLMYVYNCWYGSRCHRKEDIEKIVKKVLLDYPDETDYTKLGMIAKRRCISEL